MENDDKSYVAFEKMIMSKVLSDIPTNNKLMIKILIRYTFFRFKIQNNSFKIVSIVFKPFSIVFPIT